MEFDGVATKKKCSTPTDWAPHKVKQLKADRGLTYVQSRGLYQLTNQLLHVGTRKYDLLVNLLNNFWTRSISFLESLFLTA